MVQISDGCFPTTQPCFREGLVRWDPHVYKGGLSLSRLMCTGVCGGGGVQNPTVDRSGP